MNVQRFQAPTLRDALAKARKVFGEGTLILSNRSTADGYEVVATAEEALAEVTRAGTAGPATAMAAATPKAAPRRENPTRGQVERDTERLAMSTLSFQEYVRERMLSKRLAEQREREAQGEDLRSEMREAARGADAARARSEAPASSASAPAAVAPAINAALTQQMFERLARMQARIEERLDTVAWLGQARQSAIHSGLLLKLLRAGYSPAHARALTEAVSTELQPAEAVRQAAQAITERLITDEGQPGLIDEGGRFVLIGPAGWGKTSTVLKLLHGAVHEHGSGSVGLITLDAQRAGAHETLRQAARAAGVAAHVAHDRAALNDMLALLERKRLVLIDTVGHGTNDPQWKDTLELATLPGIAQLLVLNAAAQPEALEATIGALRTPQLAGTVLTRLDEVVRLGPSIDALVRHGLRLRGLGTGPRVPDDWSRAQAGELVKQSLKTAVRSVYDPQAEDLALHLAGSGLASADTIVEG